MVLLVLLCSAIYKLTKFVMCAGPLFIRLVTAVNISSYEIFLQNFPCYKATFVALLKKSLFQLKLFGRDLEKWPISKKLKKVVTWWPP